MDVLRASSSSYSRMPMERIPKGSYRFPDPELNRGECDEVVVDVDLDDGDSKNVGDLGNSIQACSKEPHLETKKLSTFNNCGQAKEYKEEHQQDCGGVNHLDSGHVSRRCLCCFGGGPRTARRIRNFDEHLTVSKRSAESGSFSNRPKFKTECYRQNEHVKEPLENNVSDENHRNNPHEELESIRGSISASGSSYQHLHHYFRKRSSEKTLALKVEEEEDTRKRELERRLLPMSNSEATNTTTTIIAAAAAVTLLASNNGPKSKQNEDDDENKPTTTITTQPPPHQVKQQQEQWKQKRHQTAFKKLKLLKSNKLSATSIIHLITLLLQLLPILLISLASCDSNNNVKDFERHQHHHQWLIRRRRLVDEPEPAVESSRTPAAAEAPARVSAFTKLETVRIAALASRLDQWFACNKRLPALLDEKFSSPLESSSDFNIKSDVTPGDGVPATPSSCPSHFDGHLCWPATRAGQVARLPCPQINWLPEEIFPKSTQPLPTTTTTPNYVIQNNSQEDTSSGQQLSGGSSPPNKGPRQTEPLAPRFATRLCSASRSAAASAYTGTRPNNSEKDANVADLGSPVESSAGVSITFNGNHGIAVDHWASKANYSECYQRSGRLLLDNVAGDDSAGADLSSSSPSSILDSSPESSDIGKGSQATLSFDPTDKWIKLDNQEAGNEESPGIRLFSSLVEELDRIEGTIDPYGDPDLLEQWSFCIGNIMRHYDSYHSKRKEPLTASQLAPDQQPGGNPSSPNANDLWCPIIFDGWRCWPTTRAGQVAYVGCPANQPGFSAERQAHKICTADGTWYRHPQTNRYWSNYTTCVDTNDLAFRTKILNLYVIGNLISLVALLASLIIFISFKSLSCTRVTIHKNLFLSFITNNLMWIIWYTCVVNDADLLRKNPIECQLWHILLHYFLVSNYFWMFCEGLYLHTLLVFAFISDDKILKWFYLLGWAIPVPITVTYAYKRSYDNHAVQFCWMDESPHNLILMAPIGISLLLNLIFLINIVRVLVTKLRANNSPDTHQTRKAVRATLILIPLLGLHYILTPFRPETKSEWEGIYEIIAAVCTSFQGLCVAMLFCFSNGEVMAVIKKKLKDTFNFGHQTSCMTSSQPACRLFGSFGGTNNNGNNGTGGEFNQNNKNNDNGNSKMRSRSNTVSTNCNFANGTNNSLQQLYSNPPPTVSFQKSNPNNHHSTNNSNSNKQLQAHKEAENRIDLEEKCSSLKAEASDLAPAIETPKIATLDGSGRAEAGTTITNDDDTTSLITAVTTPQPPLHPITTTTTKSTTPLDSIKLNQLSQIENEVEGVFRSITKNNFSSQTTDQDNFSKTNKSTNKNLADNYQQRQRSLMITNGNATKFDNDKTNLRQHEGDELEEEEEETVKLLQDSCAATTDHHLEQRPSNGNLHNGYYHHRKLADHPIQPEHQKLIGTTNHHQHDTTISFSISSQLNQYLINSTQGDF